MDSQAAELALIHGAADTQHAGRQLTSEMVRSSDLVLCMSREHRRAAVRYAPAASRRVFLLSEFVALVEDLAKGQSAAAGAGTAQQLSADLLRASVPERLRGGIDAAAARRGLTGSASGIPAEIIDPYRGEPEMYRESAAQIDHAAQRLHRALRTIMQGVRR